MRVRIPLSTPNASVAQLVVRPPCKRLMRVRAPTEAARPCSIKANYTGLSLRRSGFEPLHGRFTLGMWCKMSCTSRNEGYGSVHARSKSMRRSSNLTFPNRGILSIGKTSQSICPVLARMTDTLTSVLLEHKVREADCRAHNPEVRGSNPPPATCTL